jgi:hypothetical protein
LTLNFIILVYPSSPDHLWRIRLLRAASCVPLVLIEQSLVDLFFPNNAGSALFHCFILANALLSSGSAVFGFDVWRRLCCAFDAIAGAAGTSMGVLNLLP